MSMSGWKQSLLWHTIEVGAEQWPKVLKAAVSPPLQDDVGGWVEGGKVALECDVAWCHIDASTHALKRATASIMAARCMYVAGR